MTSLTEIAMDHARQRLAGQARVTPTSAAPKINMASNHVEKRAVSTIASTGFVPSGPISHHLFLEGRAWAQELARTLRVYPVPFVVERLTGVAAGKPTSYVVGVHSVIQMLTEALHGESAVLSTKVPCGSGDLSTKPVLRTELEVRPCA